MDGRYRQMVEEMLDVAGVTVNGKNPWDIQVKNPRFFRRAITEGQLGLGESYMDGWWEAPRPDEFISHILRARLDERVRRTWPMVFGVAFARAVNLQSKRHAFIVGKRHYDLGNDLFEQMLDRRMNYSCAYWDGATTLDEAQERKLDLICRKLHLQPGMRVLDIGCGWGGFGKYAAQCYKATVVGITVSREQAELGKALCKGLPVDFQLMDYRNISGTFDRIVSVGMIEHVGYKNYRRYCEVACRCLVDDGLFLLHTIGGNQSEHAIDPWAHKYIFPNAMLPSVSQLGKAIEGLFVMEDWHSFGQYYDRTVMAWHQNFTSHWERLKDKYDDRVYRMWQYFLLSSAGSLRARCIQLWQIVLSKHGLAGGYQAVR